MDPSTINTFLDRFLAMADSGFGLVAGDVNYVLNALIIISITLAGIQWALAAEAPIAPFFSKVLYVGLFAFLINNWNAIAGAINRSGAMLGLRAGGDGISMAQLHNPGAVASVGVEMFGRTAALSEGMNIITDFGALIVIYAAAFCVMLGFFLLALQVFVALISFKLGSLAAFVALPWGVFSGTSWVAERPIGWVVGSAMRLFVLAFVGSISVSFVDELPASLSLDEGGVLNVLLFGLTMMALAWFAPALASEVVQGQPHLSGGDAMRAGEGAGHRAIGYPAAAAWAGVKGGQLAVRGVRALAGKGRSGGGGASPSVNYAAMAPKAAPQPGAKA
jgi:type IV secretion system protein TrbL